MKRLLLLVALLLPLLAACDSVDGGGGPSDPRSNLEGTWRGTTMYRPTIPMNHFYRIDVVDGQEVKGRAAMSTSPWPIYNRTITGTYNAPNLSLKLVPDPKVAAAPGEFIGVVTDDGRFFDGNYLENGVIVATFRLQLVDMD